MTRNPKHLFNLLVQLFRSNDDLYEAVASRDYPQMTMLLAALPAPNSSRIVFTMTAVDLLKAHGLDDEVWFDELSRRFPARVSLIDASRRAYLGEKPEEAELKVAPIVSVGAIGSDQVVQAHEKIMGDRPTFIDVAYLAKGAEIARAVVKLRMRFAEGWYNGTAFLIAPGRLLTAHHNLVLPSGEKAVEVTAQFDYERVFEGPEPEGKTVACQSGTVRGDVADDWAVIDLETAQQNRPLARFAETAVKQGDRVAIIQHPNGMVKQVALHNNLVTFADGKRLQYLTDTLPGSSGAPVFNTMWRVVALHHAGGDLPVPGTKELVFRNQGIAIQKVIEGLKRINVIAE